MLWRWSMAETRITPPAEIMTRKNRRRFTDQEAYAILTDYVESSMGYRSMQRKWKITQPFLTDLISGKGHADAEYPDFAEMRRKAQAKAAERSLKRTRKVSLRFPDPTKTHFEIDMNSFKSVNGALVVLIPVWEKLRDEQIDDGVEVAYADVSSTNAVAVYVPQMVEIELPRVSLVGVK
jgi:hypothetical protein